MGANNNQPLRGKTWYQKEMFLISNNIDSLHDDADFKGDFAGPYSENADEALIRLSIYKIIDLKPSIKLTDFGKKVYETLAPHANDDIKEIVSEFKELLNDLSYVALLGFIYHSYPEFIGESIVKDKVFPRKKEVALNLYTNQKVSLGKASEIADISIEDFIKLIQSMGGQVYSE